MAHLAEDPRPVSPATEASFVQYAVDIQNLSDFAGFVDREVDANLDPGVGGIKADHPHGRRWGSAFASNLIGQARSGHSDALWRSGRNMVYFILTARAMTETIGRLMEIYRTSEEAAQVTPAVVANMMASAYTRNLDSLRPPPQYGFQERS